MPFKDLKNHCSGGEVNNWVGSETGSETFKKSDPDPELFEKSDPDPLQKVSDPQHCNKVLSF
jgi:hypothetical protein